MSSIFTKIIKKEIHCYKVYEDEHNIAFLDIFPIKEGHTLVIPKKEVDNLMDLNQDDYLSLWKFTKIVSNAIKKTFNPKKVGIAVIGLDVAHAHIHLVPINNTKEFVFSKKKLTFTKKEFEITCKKILSNIKLKCLIQ